MAKERSAAGRDSPSEPTPTLGRRSSDLEQTDDIARSLSSQPGPLAPDIQENSVSSPLHANGNGKHRCHHVRDEEAQPTESSPLLGDREREDEETAPAAETAQVFLLITNPGRFWLIFAVILINLFIMAFDGTIMASSHPVITSHFHAANSASWLSTSFLLTSTAFQPLFGRLTDAVGRKPLFVACAVIFFLATLWCALAGSIESFIAARALCGLAGGGGGTIGSIMTSDLVPIERRGSYQAYINVTAGVGGALGAALGGWLAESLGWRWEFGIQLPFLAFVTTVALLAIPADLGLQEDRKSTVSQQLKDFDFQGSLLLTSCITSLILGVNLGGNILPWKHPFIIASLIVFAITFPLFIWVERRATRPIMPLQVLLMAPRANLVFSNFIAALLMNALTFNLPLFFQAVLLSSATDSGLRLVMPSIVASVFGAFTGFAITWTRRLKWPPMLGSSLLLLGCVSLSLLRRDLPEIVYNLALVPSSVGQGFAFSGTFMALLASSQQKEQAVVTSTLILWRSLGLVVGVAYASLVVQNALRYYLNIYVDDIPDKAEMIENVRKSVELVAKLEQPLRDQVVMSYEAAIRLTFMTLSILSAVAVLIIIPIKLPRLPKRD
ncbi:uncharacterized protein J7T54_007058 [Emericellopsis cladophorae]|uniref:Major facilitator superfamily (MFS) profile domain-containing protein n=1 Tax=Emericellopsis cladophorae TaxID=2686198 RepID=A0A9P9Y8I8_9HYPO|nr:uncharacterized protein J7T54_007058 [Emericellopsis cladophorae]KAI6785416.1 hypothetical protein J7T54_007058 [Emericellopsis cladophorae]